MMPKLLSRVLAVRPLRLHAIALWIIAFVGWHGTVHPKTTLLLLAGCIASAVLDIAFQVYRGGPKSEPPTWETVGDPRPRNHEEPATGPALGLRAAPESEGPAAPQLPAVLTFGRAVIACPDCGEFHPVQVIIHGGRFADGIALGTNPFGDSPPGAGWWYQLTGEDQGTTDGLSIPVYRPVVRISAGEELPGAMGFAFTGGGEP
jgi:hypothetical protein